MFITLKTMSVEDLQAIVDAEVTDAQLTDSDVIEPVPSFVAKRSLAQINAGKSAAWCSPFLIVGNPDGEVMGGCGFKDVPVNGFVEIGYGVSPIYRKQGVATAAVRALLDLAFSRRSVTEVFATINPENEASIKVVRKLGFGKGKTVFDSDGEALVHWHFRKVGLPD